MTPRVVPLEPFGIRVVFPPGTRLADVDVPLLKAWVDEHRVVQLRGISSVAPQVLAAESRRLGPLQPWSFGAVHELKQVSQTENYLYTAHLVPLHWDGAFADAVPHWLVFHCVSAPPDGAGGETVFVDTVRVLERATEDQRQAWTSARFRYTTEKKAHYGGSFVSRAVTKHPALDIPVIRYAEPVEDLNPVRVEPLDVGPAEGARLMSELGAALAAPDVALSLPWREGDFVIADNHALLHGRRAFVDGAPRHIRRVNVLDPDRRMWTLLRAAWRLRRPEFFRAELPILLIPALLGANGPRDLMGLPFAESAVLFFLLFNVGDLVNCWLDRDVDLHRKTHLAEAVALIGRRWIAIQIVGSGVVAALLAVHLGLILGRAWMVPAGLLGALLGASYTAPPLRLKSRGLLQLIAYVGLLFVAPMIMVGGVFLPVPSVALTLASLGFGLMQTGVLLVNTAEDLDEDERERIRTVAVVLQARGTIRLARALVPAGAVLFVGVLASRCPPAYWFGLAPLALVACWNERWLARLDREMRGRDEGAGRSAIRTQGKHVPRRLETGAWMGFLAALASFAARSLP
jgi:alpha-ketoglutarate-dependent taurine dioxygenase/4-hydroxybenzoate polyprenyltransferase